MVVFGFELVHDRLQLAVLTDDKGCAQNAVKLTAHELFGAPGAVVVRRSMVFVTEQLEYTFDEDEDIDEETFFDGDDDYDDIW